MNHILRDLSPEAVVHALEANLSDCFYSMFAESTHHTFHADGDVRWFVSDVAFPLMNGVVSPQLEGGVEERRIGEILAGSEAARVPMLWWLGPSSRPADIGARLASRGLVKTGDLPGMAADLAKLDASEAPPRGVLVQRVDADELLSAYMQVVQQAFELPYFATDVFREALKNNGYGESADLQHYVAYLDEKPVATSTVAYGAGVAGIYNVGTLEEARGSGIGRAITLRPLLDARARGYRVGVLEASEMGYNVYKKLGFEDYCRIDLYLYTPPAE